MKVPIAGPQRAAEEGEIIAEWGGVLGSPIVSILCVTYNHANYIEHALTSFLMQQTGFSFEIWVHDDASTDGTREIVERYAKRYPRIIKTIFQDENQYSQGRKPSEFVHSVGRAPYIAMCEGDDYWTDPYKLEKQVAYLEANPGCVITGHDAFIIDSEGRLIKRSKLPAAKKRDFNARELAEGKAWVLTMSWVYRNVITEYAPERRMVRNGDSFFLSLLGDYGGSHYHDDISPAAYRVHDGGVWSSSDMEDQGDDRINTLFWMYRYYKRVGRLDLAEVFFERFLRLASSKESLGNFLSVATIRLLGIDRLKAALRAFVGPERAHAIRRFLGRA